jgi:hypothetical protein
MSWGVGSGECVHTRTPWPLYPVGGDRQFEAGLSPRAGVGNKKEKGTFKMQEIDS